MFRRKICLVLWFVFGGIFLASLPNRLAHLDDAWLGEQAFWLARDGVVRSELFRGFLGYEDRIWVFHKLFIPQGALAIDWFGWSRASLKAVSLPWFLTTLVLLFVAVRRDRHLGHGFAGWIPLLFIAHPLVVDYAYTFRPELCLTALTLGSYLALRGHLASGSRAALAAGALLAGLGLLVHLNGVIFIGAGVVLLLFERRRVAALGFLALATAVSALYGADAWLAGEWPALREQFLRDPSLEGRDFQPLGMVAKLLEEPQRWYRHGEDVATSLLVIAGLFTAGASLRREQRPLAVYTLTALVLLGLTAQSKTAKYALPLLPLLLLLVAAGMSRWRESPRPMQRAGALILALYLITCASRSLRYFSRNADEPLRHAQLLEGVEPGSVVAADLTFVFDEIERFDLRGLWAYRVAAEGRGEELDLSGLVHAARADGVGTLVFDLRRELPRRLARGWPRLAGELPARERVPAPPDALVLEIQGER